MDFWQSLSGMVEVELVSANLSAILMELNKMDIPVFSVAQEDALTMRFTIRRKDHKYLRNIVKRKGAELRACQRKGIYWGAKSLLRRPVLLLGMLLLLTLTVVLPRYVLFVQVVGNNGIPDERILEAAQTCGLSFGVSRRSLRSEEIKNRILTQVPELQWAGVNSYGCLAVISVREKTAALPQEDDSGISSIIAVTDGVITDMTVTSGTPLCKKGDAVTAGEVLVSGYTDCGICVRGVQAKAEVYASTVRELSAITPGVFLRRQDMKVSEKKISLIFGKKRINFFQGSGISDTGCVKMYTEYPLTLPGGFVLPISLVREEWSHYHEMSSEIEEALASEVLTDFASAYLEDQMIAGKILSQSQRIWNDLETFCIAGDFRCIEMIGKSRIEEKLEYYGEND